MTKFNTKAIFAGLAAAVMLTVSGIFSSASVNAEDNFPYYLLISPAKHTLGELEPGKTYDGTFLVRNVGTEDFDLKPPINILTSRNGLPLTVLRVP